MPCAPWLSEHPILPALCLRPRPPRPAPQVVKHTGLLSSSSTAFLQSKLALRAPYVVPLNILQARCAVLRCPCCALLCSALLCRGVRSCSGTAA